MLTLTFLSEGLFGEVPMKLQEVSRRETLAKSKFGSTERVREGRGHPRGGGGFPQRAMQSRGCMKTRSWSQYMGRHQRDGNRGGGTSMTKLDSGYSSTRLLFSDWPYGCPPQKPDVGEIKILCLSVSTN